MATAKERAERRSAAFWLIAPGVFWAVVFYTVGQAHMYGLYPLLILVTVVLYSRFVNGRFKSSTDEMGDQA